MIWNKFLRFFSQKKEILSSGEKKSAENQKLWFEQAMNCLPKPLFLVDLKSGKVSFSNAAAKKMLGLDYTDKSRLDVYNNDVQLHDLDRKRISYDQMPSSRVVRGEDVKGDEYILTTSVGEFYIKVFSEKIPAAHGQDAAALILFQDFTELKKTETKLIQTQKDLKEAVEIAQVGFWQLDIKTQNIVTTPILLEHFGITPKTFRATLQEAIDVIHSYDRARVTEAIAQSIATKQPYHIEYRVLRPNREIRWIEAKGNCAYDKSGDPIRFAGTTIDITERIETNKNLEASKLELQTEKQKKEEN